MKTSSCLVLSAALLGGALCAPRPAAAAADYDHCEYFVESLPATITTPGTWCLDGNLATTLNYGPALSIQADDVLLDCKRFKIGGLGAGTEVHNIGIHAEGRSGLTIRNCQVRGFHNAVELGGQGFLVEDNLVEDARQAGIIARGGGHLVRNNRIIRTGSNHSNNIAYGIEAAGDVIGNTIDGLRSRSTETAALTGIYASSDGAVVRGNVVRGFVQATSMQVFGIRLLGNGAEARDNHVMAGFVVNSPAVVKGGPVNNISYCKGNTSFNFTYTAACTWNVDNLPPD